MFAYTDEELRQIVGENLKLPARPLASNVPCHLKTMGRISLMIRKFDKAGFENYKQTLRYDFDKAEAVSQLRMDAKEGNLSSKLDNTVYFIRKFDITWQEMSDISKTFLKQALDTISSNDDSVENVQQSYLYSLALKYLFRNTKTENLLNILQPSQIISLMAGCKNSACKTELIWTLGYILGSVVGGSSDGPGLDSKLAQDIVVVVMSERDASEESKAFLLGQINAIKSGRSVGQHKNPKDNAGPTAAISRRNDVKIKKQQTVSKTVQMVKSTVKNKTGDDVQLKILNLASALKNRKAMVVASEARKHLETVNDASGSDSSIFNTTWGECLNLYQLANSGSKTLKIEDKDVYLPAKLFGAHFFKGDYLAANVLYEFYINRMIAATFKQISKKQKLSGTAIDALMNGITTVEKLSNLTVNCLMNLIRGDITFSSFCEKIVDNVCFAYSSLDSLDAPDMLRDFYKDIRDELMTGEVKAGWISGTYTERTRRESFDKNKVNGLIKKEMERLRIDIGKALYNSACHDGRIITESRMKILQSYLADNRVIADDLDEEMFQTLLLDIIDVVTMSGAGVDSLIMLNMYLKILVANSSRSNGRSAANSIVRETKSAAVCEKFMTDDVLNKLMDLLQESTTLDEVKLSTVEIINNYLEQPFCKDGLCEKHLQDLLSNVLMRTNSSKDLIDNTLISVLVTADKHQSLPSNVIKELVKLLNKPYGDFVVLILSQCMTQKIEMKVPKSLPSLGRDEQKEKKKELLSISEKLSSDFVVVEQENSMVKIEQRSDSNSESTTISLLAAQLMLAVVESWTKDIRVNETIVKNLIASAETCEDKQSRLVAIKCVYLLSTIPENGRHFTMQVMSTLESLVNSDVYVVSMYAHAAYVRVLLTLALSQDEPLKSNYMDSLASMFVIQGSLKIGDKDFVPEINERVLDILWREAVKGQKFEDEALFSTTEKILYSNKNTSYSVKVLEILETYTSHRKNGCHLIPETTIVALEHALGLMDLSSQALHCLQNVICNGQTVNSRTLQFFLDNLQMSDNSRRRIRAFKVLEKARANQDISDEAFLKLELVRAAYGLSCRNLEKADREKMMRYIQEKCERASMQLPVDTMLVLERYVNEEDTLKVIYNASKQRQLINYNLMNKLVEEFNPLVADAWADLLIDIFQNVARNNQTLSSKLLSKLELAFVKSEVSRELKVLSIFTKQIQKGEHVPTTVITKILKIIASKSTTVVTKKELLGCIGSIAFYSTDEELLTYRGTMQNILSDGVMSDNSNIQKLCVGGWGVLMSRTQVDTKYLSDLVEICTDMQLMSKCDQAVLDNLLSLLRINMDTQHGFTENLRLKLHLTELATFDDDDGYLDNLSDIMKNAKGSVALLPQNCSQLSNILNKHLPDSLKRKAKVLALLQTSDFNGEPSRDLLESIALLYESSNSKEMKESCLRLLCTSVKPGECSGRISKIISKKLERDVAKTRRKQFLGSTCSLCIIFKQDLNLSNMQIGDLLIEMNIVDIKRLETIESLEEFLEIVSKENSDYSNSSSFVQLVEQILIHSKDVRKNKAALMCYSQILKQHKFYLLKEVIENLLILSVHELQTELLIVLLECFFISIPFLVTVRPEMILGILNLCECYLEHDHAMVRSLSFAGLALVAQNYSVESDYFKDWCNMKMGEISRLTQIEFNEEVRLDILYMIVSIQYIDLNAFSKPKEVWHRELLISNIFRQLEPCLDTEKLEFYNLWLQIEEKLLPPFKSLAFLLQLNLRVSYCMKSLKQANEVLFVLIRSNTMPQLSELTNEELVQLFQQKLKEDWCVILIENSVKNEDDLDPDYIRNLAGMLCKYFVAEIIQKLFDCIAYIDNLKAFESLIELCTESTVQKISEKYFLRQVQCLSVSEFKSMVEAEQLCERFTSANAEQMETIYGVLADLLRHKGGTNSLRSCWSFKQLNKMITTIKEQVEKKFFTQSAINFFQTISYYELSSVKYEECLKILKGPESLKNLNRLVLENKFRQKDSIRNVMELLEELDKENDMKKCNGEFQTYIKTKLLKQLKEIKSNTLVSPIVNFGKLPICEWDRKHIAQWANCVKASKDKNLDIIESIAVIKRANYWHTGFHLTDTQIIASLISLYDYGSDESIRGKLLQVATGEGKSTIVCILAIVNALIGSHRISHVDLSASLTVLSLMDAVRGCTKSGQVDIITSSPVLAERDAKEKSRLFRMFDLSCSFNSDTSTYLSGAKDCYTADIVYGEVSQFQFDRLRDQYSQLGTMAGRQCRVAIVDEVDAMLIDDSSKIARLSSTAAGMDQFQPIYVFLWHKLLDIQSHFIMVEEKMYMLNGQVQFLNGKVALQYANEVGDIIEIPDLTGYTREHGGCLNPSIGKLISGSIDEFLKKTLNDYLDNLIEEQIVKIPANFEQFFSKQRSKWIDNAVEAMNYQENVQYVVHDGQIKPVDYFSTGIVQSATNWSNGLHQFLQLKHNLKMTTETLTTNFLSNIGFINYYEKLFGLTGTLGSRKAREVLESMYKVELVNVPQLRQKQYTEFPTKVSDNESKWYRDICSAALLEARRDRGALIICETIRHVNVLHERLTSIYSPSAVKIYTMNNMNQEIQIEKIRKGDIVIATNLAGRGTDIYTEAIEEAGGMHVIVTFMPQNQRVQDQAFGRTARQGKLGTGQMILNMQQLGVDYENIDPCQVRNKRDIIESHQLEQFQSDELQLIQAKDDLFQKFCKFLNEKIRYDVRSKVTKGWCQSFMDVFRNATPTTYENSFISAIEEEWAMFLRKLDDGSVNIEAAHMVCETLLNNLYEEYQSNTVIKNLYYHIVIGNYFMAEEGNAEKAKHHFEKALEKPQNKEAQDFYGAAYVGIAWSSIAIGKLKTSQPKQDLLIVFAKALDSLSTEMALINSMQGLLLKASTSGTGFAQSELDMQLNVKATILGSYLNSAQQCMRVIKRSLRLIDVVRTDEKSGVTEIFVDIDREYNLDIINWDNRDDDDATYQLAFNDLTVYQDSGTNDQAVVTIDNAFNDGMTITSLLSSEYLSCSYKRFELKLNSISLSRLRALLSENKEFEDELSAQSAIDQLKQERTYFNTLRLTNSYTVDLTIVHPDGRLDKRLGKQINTVIKIIENNLVKPQEANLRYNFTIKQANSNAINSCFLNQDKKQDLEVTFEIAFNGVDCKSAQKLSTMLDEDRTTCEVTMLVTKADILSLLNKRDRRENLVFEHNKHFQFSIGSEDGKKFEKVKVEELRTRMECVEEGQKVHEIKVRVSPLSRAQELFLHFPDSTCNITLGTVSFNKLWLLLSDKEELERTPTSVSFQGLDRALSKIFIAVFRSESIEFCLLFNDLTNHQALNVIQKANLKQEELEICKARNLAELFMKNHMPYVELAELASKGIEYLLEITEKRFIPWTSICTVAVLGCLQVVIGGVLIATGFGATVGMSFISEGLSDLMYAYRAYSSRQFDWTDYSKQKAISLIISVCSVGLGKLKDAGTGVTNVVSGEAAALAQEAGKEAAEAATTQFIANSKAIGQEMLKTGANLKSLAFKYVGVKAGETVVREGMNAGVQYLTNLSMDALKPYICADVERRVQARFSYPQLNNLLRKMYTLDALSGSKSLQDNVNRIVSNAVNPERCFLQKQWNSIALPLLKGVLGTTEKYGSITSMGFRVIGTLQGLYALQAIIDNVYEEVLKKLTRSDEDTLTTNLLLQQHCKINRDKSRILSQDLSAYRIDITCIVTAQESDHKELNIKIRKYRETNEQVGSFLENFLGRLISNEDALIQSISLIIKSVTDRITDQIIRIIDSQLVSPWSTYATSSLTDALSKRIQHYCLVDRQQNTDDQNDKAERCEEINKKKASGEKLTNEEKDYLKNFDDYKTFGQQINSNAQAYCKDCQKFKVKYYSEQAAKGEVSQDVKKLAEDVRGNKPASMAEISAMSKKLGLKLKVTQDLDYKPTPEEAAQGVKVIYILPGEKDENGVDQIGHAFFVNDKGYKVYVKSEPNDCLYAVASEIMKSSNSPMTTQQLRDLTAESIESNANFTKVLEAEKWVHDRYPAEANTLLFSAGILYDEKTENFEVEDEDMKNLDQSVEAGKEGFPCDKLIKRLIRRGDDLSGFTLLKEDGTEERITGAGNVHLHHVVSRWVLEEIVKETQGLPPEEKKKVWNRFVNQPHIKPLIENTVLDENGQVRKDIEVRFNKDGEPLKGNHGSLLHAVAIWNPKNLVAGPSPQDRIGDTQGSKKESLDKNISAAQSPGAQNKVNECLDKRSLDSVGNLASEPVKWEETRNQQKQLKKNIHNP